MLIDTWGYWVSFVQVILGSAILIVVMPMIMWRRYLKNKSRAFIFMFSVLTQNAFLISLVMVLGIFNVLNRGAAVICIGLFYIIVSMSLSKFSYAVRMKRLLLMISKVMRGTAKPSMIIRAVKQRAVLGIQKIKRSGFVLHIRLNWLEYVLLLIAVCYNLWFMASNALTYHSVQFSDIPVHQAWIYGMNQGTIFIDGIYPFGMHAIVYLVQNLFFLELREVLLYFGAFQTALLLVMTYLLAREIFKWKYSAFIVIIFFTLILNQGRFAASLPQECGMFAVSGAAYSLHRFFRTPLKSRQIQQDGKIRRFFRINQYFTHRYLTADILLFTLSVALCVEYHFYTAIAASFLVIFILLAHISKMIYKRYWVPIIAAGCLGVLIAIIPFAASYARGVPFQESMQWAMTVMSGKEWKGSDADYQTMFEQSLGENRKEDDEMPIEGNAVQGAEKESDSSKPKSFKELLQRVYRASYNFSLSTLFGNTLADVLMAVLVLGFLFSTALLPFKKNRVYSFAYLGFLFYTSVMLVMGAAQSLGIPEIFAAARASTFIQPYLGLVFAIPCDSIFGLLSEVRGRAWKRSLYIIFSALCVVLIFFIQEENWTRKHFDVNVAYYNEPDYLVKQIRKNFSKDSFTVVSPTEEYYLIIDYGFHEELSFFMDMINKKSSEYYIPTPNVFIFIEKKVLSDYYYGSPMVNIEYALKDLVYIGSNQDYYFQRAVIQSQAYYWAQAYQKMYPDTFTTYFENDIYVCYKLTQNPYYLNDFGIDYLSEYMEGGIQ